jgi:hypothetical protein
MWFGDDNDVTAIWQGEEEQNRSEKFDQKRWVKETSVVDDGGVVAC